MKKTSIDALLRRKLQSIPPSQKGGVHRYKFLAVWKEIKAALDKGYPVKVVWEVLYENGIIPSKYPWFLRLIRKQLQVEAKGDDCSNIRIRQNHSTAYALHKTNEGLVEQPAQKSASTLLEEASHKALSPNFGQARSDLTLDDFFGLTDTNVIEELK